LHQKCQIQDYQKDWLSVCRILSLQLKPKLGRMLLVGHRWFKAVVSNDMSGKEAPYDTRVYFSILDSMSPRTDWFK